MADHIPLKPAVVFTAPQDLDVTCNVQLTLPDGKFSRFTIDREMAYGMVIELVYHLRRQEEAQADAPIQAPPGYPSGPHTPL